MMLFNHTKQEATKKRILLVDDEETLRLSIKQVLDEDGYEVITAKNGEEALGHVRDKGFDLVITDLRMPGLSGMQLISEIKKTHPLTRSIIISGYGTMETVVEAMRLGIDDFVAKPFKVKSMEEIVARVLDASKKESTAVPVHSSPIEGKGCEHGVAANAGMAERGTKSATDAPDSIIIRSNLPYYLDQSQDASDAFFDAVEIAEKKFILIFGSTHSNYEEAETYCDTSLLGTMVKTIFRTVVSPFIMPDESGNYNHPQHVVEKINRYLCLNTKPRIPISLFCALIDGTKGVIEYVNQGQKLFCCLLQEDLKIVTLKSSPYLLNLFSDVYVEGEKASITCKSKLILSSSDVLTTLPIDEKSVKANLKSIFLEASLHKGEDSAFTKEVGDNYKETVRKVRTTLSCAVSADKPGNDWAVAVVDLNWERDQQSTLGGCGIEPKQEKIIIPASTNDFREIVSQIENILKRFGLSPQKWHGIVTAINEAIINARLFAYNDESHRIRDVKTGDIEVQFMIMGNELIIEVLDCGCGFEVQSYKKPDLAEYRSVTREGGRGIFLMQELMDRVMIQSSDNIGTRVYMAKEVI